MTDETLATTIPDTTDSKVSDEVCTVTPWPMAASPMLNPLIVMVKEGAAMLAPDILKTANVSVDAMHTAIRFGTLLTFGKILGVTERLSNPVG